MIRIERLFGTLLMLGVGCAAVPAAHADTRLWEYNLAIYDDSWQWGMDECEGPFGVSLPCPVVTQALRHEVKLVITGPEGEQLESDTETCAQEAVTAGAVAGVVSAVTTEGAGTVPAALATFKSYFTACMGDRLTASVNFSIEDDSHWVDN